MSAPAAAVDTASTAIGMKNEWSISFVPSFEFTDHGDPVELPTVD